MNDTKHNKKKEPTDREFYKEFQDNSIYKPRRYRKAIAAKKWSNRR